VPALPVSGRPAELESRLIALVRSSSVLMRALRAARTVDPPDWLIGAGAVRERVWDHLHGFAHQAASRDLDLAFFDPDRLGSDAERSVQMALTEQAPDISWDVTNHAAAHLWYPDVFGVALAPLSSCAEGVGTWPETATAVGVRLLADERIEVIAPCGLEDLFGLICRPNPRLPAPERYRRRVHRLQIAERWPRVQILDAPD